MKTYRNASKHMEICQKEGQKTYAVFNRAAVITKAES